MRGACLTCGTNGRCFHLLSIPHTHHCGGGAVRVLTEGTVNHLQVCPVLGRNSAPHDEVRDVHTHLVVQTGITDATVEG